MESGKEKLVSQAEEMAREKALRRLLNQYPVFFGREMLLAKGMTL